MKQFFTTALAAFLGTIVGLVVLSFISMIVGIVMIVAMASSIGGSTQPAVIDDNSILHLDLSGVLKERTLENDKLASFFNESDEDVSLQQMLVAIDAAKHNDKIKGIFLDCNGLESGLASLYELRQALDLFKKESKNKWIYAYGNEGISQSDYYLASSADSIFLNPIGSVDIHGLVAVTPYFKTLLDNIGVEMQVVKVGTFKSAVEPFLLTEMSEPSKLQQQSYLDNMWSFLTNDMAKKRKFSVPEINTYANSITITCTPNELIKMNIVDKACYKWEFEDKLRARTNVETGDDLRYVSPAELSATIKETKTDNKIAVLYAVGEINSSSEDGIIADEMISNIQDAATDDEILGLVMRVNSGGGSAFDSEQIWAALQEFKKTGKPYAVSMGDYAASGGYYIACGADKIFAEPVTLTGSIGIFGMIPCVKDLMQNKIGVNTGVVQTNANGDMGILTKPLTPFQRQSLQNMVNQGYELFTSRCADGRNIPIDSLKMIAEGRVWDGAKALELGLVDELGGLNDAVVWVSQQIGKKEYNIVTMPDEKDFFTKYVAKYLSTKAQNLILDKNTIEMLKFQEQVKHILDRDKVQAIMTDFKIQ